MNLTIAELIEIGDLISSSLGAISSTCQSSNCQSVVASEPTLDPQKRPLILLTDQVNSNSDVRA